MLDIFACEALVTLLFSKRGFGLVIGRPLESLLRARYAAFYFAKRGFGLVIGCLAWRVTASRGMIEFLDVGKYSKERKRSSLSG